MYMKPVRGFMDTELLEKTTQKRLEYIYKMSALGIGGHLFVVLMIAYLFLSTESVSPAFILLGVAAHVLILVGRTVTVVRYQRVHHTLATLDDYNLWIRYYLLGVMGTGFVWGLSVFPLDHITDPAYHFLLLSVIIGLAGAGLVTLGVFQRVYAAFMLPMLCLTGLWFATHDDNLHRIGSLIVVLVIFYFLFSAYRYSTNFAKVIFEKVKTFRSQLEIVQRLSRAAEFRDNETGMHIERMSYACYLLALACGMDERKARAVQYASSMHDIGKIGIQDDILLKPEKLDAEEWRIMQTHTLIGQRILENSESMMLRMAEQIALTHHEKYDGSGYPHGLKGDDIPLEGRIAAICDVFDALSTDRPYKKAWSNEEALAYLVEGAGSHFDPELVTLFLKIYPEVVVFQNEHLDQ
jgi:putative two-component system response regulator